MAVRNGPLEEFHADRRPIGQKEMEAINRYAYNVLCCLISWYSSEKLDELITVCGFESHSVSYFDPPDYNSEEVQDLYRIYQILSKE